MIERIPKPKKIKTVGIADVAEIAACSVLFEISKDLLSIRSTFMPSCFSDLSVVAVLVLLPPLPFICRVCHYRH